MRGKIKACSLTSDVVVVLVVVLVPELELELELVPASVDVGCLARRKYPYQPGRLPQDSSG